MPQKSYTIMPPTKSQPRMSSLTSSKPVNFEAPDPADLYAQRYRQSLPPHPAAHFLPLRPAPPPPPHPPLTKSKSNPTRPREKIAPASQQPRRPLEMRPLADIGRHTTPSLKQLARTASSASSTRTTRSLPRIDEVPDLDHCSDDINSVNGHSASHSRSSSSSSSGMAVVNCVYISNEEQVGEYAIMDAREAAIRASIERTSWMIDDDDDNNKGRGKGRRRGSKDLVEHINYVISAWQREK